MYRNDIFYIYLTPETFLIFGIKCIVITNVKVSAFK